MNENNILNLAESLGISVGNDNGCMVQPISVYLEDSTKLIIKEQPFLSPKFVKEKMTSNLIGTIEESGTDLQNSPYGTFYNEDGEIKVRDEHYILISGNVIMTFIDQQTLFDREGVSNDGGLMYNVSSIYIMEEFRGKGYCVDFLKNLTSDVLFSIDTNAVHLHKTIRENPNLHLHTNCQHLSDELGINNQTHSPI